VRLTTCLAPDKIRKRRTLKEKLKNEIGLLKDDIKDLDSEDDFERRILEEKTDRLKRAELEFAIVEPELALVAADESEKERIKRLEQDYELAWYEYQLFQALRARPVNEEEVNLLRSRIKNLQNLKEQLVQV
jgi:hypothetical protein